MQVDDALLSRLEKLSFLKVSDDKREEMIHQLSEIVSFVDNLSDLNTDGVDDNFSMDDAKSTRLREDSVSSSLELSQEILKNAPKSADDFFVVPKIIE